MPATDLMPMTATVELLVGTGGDLTREYSEAIPVRCLVTQKATLKEAGTAREEVWELVAYCEPGLPDVPTGSRLNYGGVEYEVTYCRPWRMPGASSLESVELGLH